MSSYAVAQLLIGITAIFGFPNSPKRLSAVWSVFFGEAPVGLPSSSARLEALWAIGVAQADQSDAAGEAGLAARLEVLEVGQVDLWAWAGEADLADRSPGPWADRVDQSAGLADQWADQARSAGRARIEDLS